MTKVEFRRRVFEIARAKHLRINPMRDGKIRIWFNEKSKKFLHESHLDDLYDQLHRPGLSRSEIRAEIERIAPGRPCTHKLMCEIYEQLHSA